MPLVADLSSTILSRPLDVSRFGVIYAGAQKNIGPAGLVVVIVRDDLLGHARPDTPTVFDWKAMAADGSMLNTPATYSWYMAGAVFQWMKRQGGLAAMERLNRAKAEMLYDAIDGSGFYRNPVAVECRSWMNVPFTLPNEAWTSPSSRRQGRGPGDTRRASFGRRNERQHLQRHADGGRRGAGRVHEGVPGKNG